MDKVFQFEASVIDKSCQDLFTAEARIPVIVDAEYYEAEPEEELKAEIFLNVRRKSDDKIITADLSETEYLDLLDIAWEQFYDLNTKEDNNQIKLDL